jgi:cytochrome c oxidase cbb3-type subunit III
MTMKLTIAVLVAGLFTAVVAAQQPPAPQTPQPPAGGNPEGVFPAQQRELAAPAVIERGRGIYAAVCSSCHGADLRGGQLGGPNLLRSQVVLSDQHGELIRPIVHGSRAERGMPPLPLEDPDIDAVAEYIHSVLAAAQGQGAPPPSLAPPPNAIVGNAEAGQKYFAATCSRCHSATGDLQGIGSRLPEGKALQTAWVTGGGGGRRGPAADPARAARRAPTATVVLQSGQRLEGRLVRLDNFFVTLALDDGSQRTIRRTSPDVPRIDVTDPLAAHKALLATLTDTDMHDVTAYLATLK